MKILVAYDGTIHAKKALKYGISKIRKEGGELTLLHVFDRNCFVDYDAGPKAEELTRAEAAQQLEAARNIILETAAGIPTRIVSEEGDAEQTVLRYAATDHPDLLLAPPSYKGIVKTSLCPVYIIPGTILVPVDDTDTSLSTLDRIREEVEATGSKVMLLGVVPIHLYSKEEKSGLEKVKKETSIRLKRVHKMLVDQGIETKKIMRSGYPDEEIMKAADEFSVSMVILPSGGNTPSELRKAAAIILGERDRMIHPLVVVPTTETA